MALTATMYRFDIDLSDVDRGVYQNFEVRIAMHPSETTPCLITRVIAYALHQVDDIGFSSGGLSDHSEPALLARDLTGQMLLWIDIGNPSPERLHKATKSAKTVIVYTYKKPQMLIDAVAKANVHRAEDIACFSLAPAFLNTLGDSLARNNRWNLVRTEGELFIDTGSVSATGQLESHALGAS